MNVWNGVARLPRDFGPAVATIGNYDGVHLGHQAILSAVIKQARSIGAPSLLITFDPHPLSIVAPSRSPQRLQTRHQKLVSLGATGLSDLLILEFNPSIAALSGEEFFAQVLDPWMKFHSIHVGESFRFGHDRHGDIALLSQMGASRGFQVCGIEPVHCDGEIVSSSVIRRAVAAGDVEQARRMLGRPFALEGEIVAGEGRGRQLNFPTANLAAQNEQHPKNGVYVTELIALATRHPSVSNVGVRPTFGESQRVVESHVLGFDGDLYGAKAELRFLARLRDEMKFAGVPELADQIARDRAAAEAFFQNRLPVTG